MYHKQEYLLLTVNVYSYGLVSILTSIVSLQDPLQWLKSLFRVHSGRLFSYSKKRTITQNDDSLSLVIICCHSLSFDVIRCHSLSLIVPLVVTRCTTRCHSLSFVVTRCTTRFHSLSLLFTRCITLSFYKRSLSLTFLINIILLVLSFEQHRQKYHLDIKGNFLLLCNNVVSSDAIQDYIVPNET